MSIVEFAEKLLGYELSSWQKYSWLNAMNIYHKTRNYTTFHLEVI